MGAIDARRVEPCGLVVPACALLVGFATRKCVFFVGRADCVGPLVARRFLHRLEARVLAAPLHDSVMNEAHYSRMRDLVCFDCMAVDHECVYPGAPLRSVAFR